MEGEAFASLSGASKFYGSYAALKDVSLTLRCGEVHMLLGENGAGKSTLVSLLTGSNMMDAGERMVRGKPCATLTPLEAREAGINAVLQDFALAPTLTVAENYALGRERTRSGFLDKSAMRNDVLDAMRTLGVQLDPDVRVDTLTRAEQQLLEILRALGGKPGALILDEPTATLSHDESEHLFSAIAALKQDGWAILYISHRMEEIRRLGDVVTILRDGRQTGFHRLADVTNDQMIAEMVGREMSSFYPDIAHAPAGMALEVRGLSSGGKLKDASITVRFGEIVGLGGLVGCGKAELARVVFGLMPIDGGEILVEGQSVTAPTPKSMLNRGLIYLPQDRRGEALALNRSIADNVVLEVLGAPGSTRCGFVQTGVLSALVSDLLARLKVQPAEPQKKVQELSGGNQQKVVLGRALSRSRKIYIFDEPTAGIDVGARLDFYHQLQQLCRDGAAILLVSSDLQELVHLSHRAYVMHEGAAWQTLAARTSPRMSSSPMLLVRSRKDPCNDRTSLQRRHHTLGHHQHRRESAALRRPADHSPDLHRRIPTG
ncbi:sugar ABC transporter ATP-binding protein [Rhodopseudomonas sp. P2A-2r]|uniref:sugar ABC transporter ATP-binding protein n=1 Tax=Rhodopseudomonas sp. P2A-2r TaxID=2991972 RepID=UPI002234CD3E|nr:sugar ABC transporter ATP-binding protein [Rhodopseudomonas sp. P2A-2r]UZE50917.1 sugar ABC transporter ATP-binding protein [Rhodopseudomonas sp. P2A-2r]